MGVRIRKPKILGGPCFFDHKENLMKNEGDVALAREHYVKERPYALEYLLHTRYDWMKEYIRDQDKIVEFGAGAAFSRICLHHDGMLVTDVSDYPWIDETVDAMSPPYADESFDIVLCSHMIHHLASPVEFLRNCERLLKPGGYILIIEPYASLTMRFVLWLMRHEGFSYEVDPFRPGSILTNPKDPWSANNAVSQLVFENNDQFSKHFPNLEIQRFEKREFLLLLLSGGVVSKTYRPPLPNFMVRLLDKLDAFLIWLLPSIFALTVRIVVQKKSD